MAAKKATASKAAAKAAPKTPTVTVETTPATQDPTIEFRGRTIPVQVPGGGALAMWRHTMGRFEALGEVDGEPSAAERQEMLKLLDRFARMILSLFADEADRDWLEEQLLDQTVTDRDLTELMRKVVESVGGQDERARLVEG